MFQGPQPRLLCRCGAEIFGAHIGKSQAPGNRHRIHRGRSWLSRVQCSLMIARFHRGCHIFANISSYDIIIANRDILHRDEKAIFRRKDQTYDQEIYPARIGGHRSGRFLHDGGGRPNNVSRTTSCACGPRATSCSRRATGSGSGGSNRAGPAGNETGHGRQCREAASIPLCHGNPRHGEEAGEI